jgi:hypothetical protein
VPHDEEDTEYVNEFLRFLGVVTQNKLGLLSGVDLDDRQRFKGCVAPLRNEELWNGAEVGSLVRT